jgi:outer membrane biosynthesis protein TonB
MYFDFYEDHPDFVLIARDMQRVEGNLHLILSILVAGLLNLTALIALILLPTYLDVDAAARRAAEEAALARVQQQREATRFVFMSPRVETPPPKSVSPLAELSDRDRRAQAPERAQDPTNLRPFSRGNTFERMDNPGNVPQRMARNQNQPSPEQVPPADRTPPGQEGENGNAQQPGSAAAVALPNGPQASARTGTGGAAPGAPGRLADSLRNLGRYVQSETFNNPQGGGGQPGASIQFDSKGVDFGPWLRRFIAQIRRNWNIPYAAMAFKGHVVIQFNVHRDGSISDLAVPGPSNVDGFNSAAYGALVASNPTEPLPREYPADRCFFTVTFFYNEQPPDR